jgi:hypothetical protein
MIGVPPNCQVSSCRTTPLSGTLPKLPPFHRRHGGTRRESRAPPKVLRLASKVPAGTFQETGRSLRIYPPVLFKRPGGLFESTREYFSRDPGVSSNLLRSTFQETPGSLRIYSGILFKRPGGLFESTPGVLFRRPRGLFESTPGYFSRDPGVSSNLPGSTFQETPASLRIYSGVLFKRPGSLFEPIRWYFSRDSRVSSKLPERTF